MATLRKAPLSDNPGSISSQDFSGIAEKPLSDHLSGETLVPLSVIGPLFPDQQDSSTVWRWATQGVNGVGLASTRAGKRIFTSQAAAERFIAACNAG